MKKILVLGGGYAGLSFLRALSAKALAASDFTLIDQNDFHYKTTQLHKLAASESENVIKKFEKILPKNVKFLQKKISKIEPEFLLTKEGEKLKFDELIIAAGASANPFNITGLEDALEIGDYERAAAAKAAIDALPAGANVAVLGAGFSGCELAGSLAREKNLNIDLIEAMDEILPMYPASLAAIARQKLEKMGVKICSGQKILALRKNELECEKAGEKVLKTYDAVVFTAGVRGSELLEECFIPARGRRVAVDEFLRAPGCSNVYVIGDSAAFMAPNGRPFAPTAQIAAQMGKYLARCFNARASGEAAGGAADGENSPAGGGENLPAAEGFKYSDKGSVCSLGKADAVGFVFGKELSGQPAVWLKNFTDLKWDLAIF